MAEESHLAPLANRQLTEAFEQRTGTPLRQPLESNLATGGVTAEASISAPRDILRHRNFWVSPRTDTKRHRNFWVSPRSDTKRHRKFWVSPRSDTKRHRNFWVSHLTKASKFRTGTPLRQLLESTIATGGIRVEESDSAPLAIWHPNGITKQTAGTPLPKPLESTIATGEVTA